MVLRRHRRHPDLTTFYIFGESPNDTSSLVHLINAVAEGSKKKIKTVPLRAPLIQQKGTLSHTRRSNATKVESAIKSAMRSRREKKIVVVAHQDCDQVEPAHIAAAQAIEDGLKSVGLPIIAATPAYEMETWWYLWPDAVAKVCSYWRKLGRTGTDLGLIYDAKGALKRDLRPSGKVVRDYDENDGPTIARHVREMGIIDKRNAKSDSFVIFSERILDVL